MLIDTHTHLYEPKFDSCRKQLIESLMPNGIDKVICVGCNIETSKQSVEYSLGYDFIYAAVGYHPNDVEDITAHQLEEIERLAMEKKVVAIGEIGLDYYHNYSDRDKQKFWFSQQLDLAKAMDLPVIIHTRDSTLDTLEIVRQHKGIRGVFHCYSGSLETLDQVLNLGFYISLGGVVTFKNAKTPKEVAKQVPLDRLLLETDCPYLAPEPYRGSTNTPLNVRLVAKQIAMLRDMDFESIANITSQNAHNLFGL